MLILKLSSLLLSILLELSFLIWLEVLSFLISSCFSVEIIEVIYPFTPTCFSLETTEDVFFFISTCFSDEILVELTLLILSTEVSFILELLFLGVTLFLFKFFAIAAYFSEEYFLLSPLPKIATFAVIFPPASILLALSEYIVCL